jgi:hypothetical protein
MGLYLKQNIENNFKKYHKRSGIACRVEIEVAVFSDLPR